MVQGRDSKAYGGVSKAIGGVSKAIGGVSKTLGGVSKTLGGVSLCPACLQRVYPLDRVSRGRYSSDLTLSVNISCCSQIFVFPEPPACHWPSSDSLGMSYHPQGVWALYFGT